VKKSVALLISMKTKIIRTNSYISMIQCVSLSYAWSMQRCTVSVNFNWVAVQDVNIFCLPGKKHSRSLTQKTVLSKKYSMCCTYLLGKHFVLFFRSIVHIGVVATVPFNKSELLSNGSGEYEIEIEWTPSENDEGHNYICFAATESTGYFFKSLECLLLFDWPSLIFLVKCF